MKRILTRVLKWLAIAISAVIVIVLALVAVLTTPGPFFPESKKYGAITVHSETPIGPEVDSMMAEVLMRLEAVPIYDPEREINLSLCTSQDKFGFFAGMTLREERIMGFALYGNCYVNGDFLEELAQGTGGKPKYVAREGSKVHAALHELMHLYLADEHGEIASRSLPTWKVEGYCEYGSNHFAAARDSGYSIPERIDIYLDDSRWNLAASTHRPHYLWGLMVEYLANVRGLSFAQVMDDRLLNHAVYQEMMAWRRSL